MQKYLCLSAIAAGACNIAPAQPVTHALTWSAETVLATPQLLHSSSDSSSRGAFFLRPVSIRANAHTIVVADVGDDRILMLDSAGKIGRSVGSRGRGPGELFGVSHVALRNNSILIGEAHNGRISEFTLGGTFVTTYAAGFAAGAVAASDHHVFTAARSADFYATLVRPDAPPMNALPRPSFGRTDRHDRWARAPGHDLIVSDSSRTWVFDQGRGFLCGYDAPDAPPDCSALPVEVLDRLRRYRTDRVDRLEKTIRMRVEAASLAKDLVIAGHYLALLLPFADVPVLLIDPADGTLTPVMTLGATLPDWARSARSFAWDGRGFLLIGDGGLGRFNISHLQSAPR